ncbi:putative restriction endonuclease [Phytophthora infestans]|uniref:Putative restriction endonuclease n=1 Tax=Phytophthora infestans TaxID=4787 RepID=A0A833WVD6_PHYIN|nr:putative restriction endonuclease [Phytophthora infestans]KAF4135151.1 putative restriction endonuclease [Phytophthora infestans]
MVKAIVLPNGTQVPASPGKYSIVTPPDLTKVVDRRFLLEYDFPFLLVQDMSTTAASNSEQNEAVRQAENWRVQHPRIKAIVGGCRLGYQFNKPPSRRARGCRRQLIPDVSYIDESTWLCLTPEEKDKGYLPCVPAVVIELMSATDKIENLQAKVTKFINAGTREGVIVDTRRDRVWIYKRNQQPYYDSLAPIMFDSWPGFTLNCIAIRDARTQAGLT